MQLQRRRSGDQRSQGKATAKGIPRERLRRSLGMTPKYYSAGEASATVQLFGGRGLGAAVTTVSVAAGTTRATVCARAAASPGASAAAATAGSGCGLR